MRPLEFLLFKRHYFPTFMAGVFLAIISGVIASILVFDAFFTDVALDTRLRWLGGAVMTVTLLISLCNLLIIWGRTQWTWGVAFVLLSCLFVVLPTIEHRPHKFMYVLGVLFPLLGLFVLNTRRHRELRRVLVIVRAKRERFVGMRRARAKRLKACERK